MIKEENITIVPLEDFIKEQIAFIWQKNPEAGRFLNHFIEYTHRVDDIIDENITDSEYVLKTLVMLSELHSSNYYLKNSDFLFGILITIANGYADSVSMEKSNIVWK